MAALVEGRLDGAVARWSRPWTLGAWAFLTLGIALGSWWAYYELGWGGWWFWDPVENASLLPWLLGTALLHAAIAYEKRGIYGYAVLLLSVVTFALSMLGTFVVRSGVLSSVHAFAVDPGRGISLLLLLAALLTVGLGLFALRADTALAPVRFSLLSKEGALGACIALLCVATACILLGTLYPLIYKLLGWGAISVGAPYFNFVFVPFCLLALLLLPLAAQLRWKKLPAYWLRTQWPSLLVGTVAGTWLCLRHTQQPQNALTLLACVLACWVLVAHAFAIVRERLGARTGMHLAHVGVALVVIGAAQLEQFTQEKRLAMQEGVTYPLGDYSFVLNDATPVIGPNFTAEQLNITVYKDLVPVARLHPQRRHYTVRAMNMNEVGLQWGWLGDFYVVPGDKLSASSWSAHIQYKPMVRWVWVGALCMVLGALLSLAQRRRSPQTSTPQQASSHTMA
jgi:cytochrome c-type biogenesis protein NrfE